MVDVPFEMLQRAIDIFVDCAYNCAEIPEAITARIKLDKTRPIAELLDSPPFEQFVAEAPYRETAYCLRIGSRNYPHLKLEVRPFPCNHRFLFWVDTHDRFFSPSKHNSDMECWRQVVQENREMKQTIERAWAASGLPTFVTAVQESLQSNNVPLPNGQENEDAASTKHDVD